MRVSLVLVLPVALSLIPGIAGSQEKKTSQYLLWHLMPAAGSTPELTTKVEKSLRHFFEKQKPGKLMDAMTMDSLILVEGNEKFLRCGTGPACISGLGELAGIPWVIAGEVRLTGGRVITELVLVDTAKKTVVSRAAVESGGPPGHAHMEELAVAMFEPEQYRGSLELSCAVEGAEVFLDGEKVGSTPLDEPLAGIAAGKHKLEVKKLGHQPFSREIRVNMGETRRVVALLPEERRLHQAPTPFYKHWAFYTCGGIGLVSTVLAVVLHVDAVALDDDVARLKEENPNSKEYQDRKDLRDARYTQTYIAYAVGGAGLLAAGIVAILDLARDGQSDNVQIGVAPGLDGFGITATIRF
jgi:hypothetical protein